MQNESQAEAVARIALSIDFTMDAKKDSRSIIDALNRAYEAGFQKGFSTADDHNFKVQMLINDLWAGKAP